MQWRRKGRGGSRPEHRCGKGAKIGFWFSKINKRRPFCSSRLFIVDGDGAPSRRLRGKESQKEHKWRLFRSTELLGGGGRHRYTLPPRRRMPSLCHCFHILLFVFFNSVEGLPRSVGTKMWLHSLHSLVPLYISFDFFCCPVHQVPVDIDKA